MAFTQLLKCTADNSDVDYRNVVNSDVDNSDIDNSDVRVGIWCDAFQRHRSEIWLRGKSVRS